MSNPQEFPMHGYVPQPAPGYPAFTRSRLSTPKSVIAAGIVMLLQAGLCLAVGAFCLLVAVAGAADWTPDAHARALMTAFLVAVVVYLVFTLFLLGFGVAAMAGKRFGIIGALITESALLLGAVVEIASGVSLIAAVGLVTLLSAVVVIICLVPGLRRPAANGAAPGARPAGQAGFNTIRDQHFP